METALWDALAAPFAASELTWRVVWVSPDGLSAQVRPQLPAALITARLDAVLGVGGWSHSFVGLGERGLSCTLTVLGGVSGVQKSAAVAYTENVGVEAAAADALAAAAAFFGLRSPVSLDELPWVDFDAEQGQILYEPDAAADPSVDVPDDAATDAPDDAASKDAAEDAPSTAAPPPSPPPPKSAGQQAIDKLLDRLKSEGRGLQAAKLLNTYGGYGSDPQAARELYARLRELLMERPAE